MVTLSLKGFEFPYELRVFEKGESALEYLQKRGPHAEAARPDLVLLDWALPGMNGGEVLREIRNDEVLKDIPVVVMTGSDIQELNKKAYDDGANLYITKPMTLYRYTTILQFVVEALQKGELPPPFSSHS